MLHPIEKPKATELRKSTLVGFTERNDGTRVVRYVIPSPHKPVAANKLQIPDFVFETHVPQSGLATWWQVIERNPAFDL